MSAEAIQDVEYDLSGSLARAAAKQIAYDSGTAFTTTVLSGISDFGTATDASSASFFDFDDLILTVYNADPAYRTGASWILSDGAAKKTRQVKASTSGEYLWTEDGSAGQPGTLLGAPVYIDPGLSNPGSVVATGIYGNAEAGLVIAMTALRVETSRSFRFSEDQLALKVVGRLAIGVKDANALGTMTCANSCPADYTRRVMAQGVAPAGGPLLVWRRAAGPLHEARRHFLAGRRDTSRPASLPSVLRGRLAGSRATNACLSATSPPHPRTILRAGGLPEPPPGNRKHAMRIARLVTAAVRWAVADGHWGPIVGIILVASLACLHPPPGPERGHVRA